MYNSHGQTILAICPALGQLFSVYLTKLMKSILRGRFFPADPDILEDWCFQLIKPQSKGNPGWTKDAVDYHIDPA